MKEHLHKNCGTWMIGDLETDSFSGLLSMEVVQISTAGGLV